MTNASSVKRKYRSECNECGGEDCFLLHSVIHRRSHRRFCTSCLLSSFQGLFCPICLEVIEETPPIQDRMMCFKCPSITHLACMGSSDADATSHYECDQCRNPNFTFFSLKLSVSSDGVKQLRGEFDKDSAKKLLAASKIAYMTLRNAAAEARCEAERKGHEAVLAKKKAREALEKLSYEENANKGKPQDQVRAFGVDKPRG